MNCPHCEEEVRERDYLCSSCGEPLREGQPAYLYVLPAIFVLLILALLLAAFFFRG
jgi:uncharacterized protein (DUF983 family)